LKANTAPLYCALLYSTRLCSTALCSALLFLYCTALHLKYCDVLHRSLLNSPLFYLPTQPLLHPRLLSYFLLNPLLSILTVIPSHHQPKYVELFTTYFVLITSSGYAANNAVPPANPPADKLHTNTRQNYVRKVI
jgi:hypothetical protein